MTWQNERNHSHNLLLQYVNVFADVDAAYSTN